MKISLTAALMLAACVYISTACPTIYIGDSGETCATGFTLGIGHPPGYPLYTLISKIFTYVPLGDMAFRINLLAAAAGTLAVLFLFLLAVEFMALAGAKENFNRICALVVSLGFAFSGTFWFEALHAKGGIYTITILAVSAAVYFTLKFYNTNLKKYMYMAVYTAGFLPLIHLSASLAMFFVIFLILIKTRSIKDKNMALTAIFLVTSLTTPVLYLLIRAFSQTEIRWADVNSIDGVIGVILRKTYYNPLDMPFSMRMFFFKSRNGLLQYFRDFLLFIPFVIYGFYKVYRHDAKVFFSAAGFIALNAAAVVVLTGNSFSPLYLYVNKGFYLIPYMGTMIFAAFGMYHFAVNLRKHIDPGITAGVLAAIPAFMLGTNYIPANLSSSFIAYDHAVNIEKTLKPGDTLLCGADTPVFNIAYLKYVKGGFKDIKIYDVNANLFDLTPYAKFRGKMTLDRLKLINAILAASNPGRVYASEFLVYAEYNLKPEAFGIINALVDLKSPPLAGVNISEVYTVRDYMNRQYADIMCREITARYFISKAQQQSLKGDRQGFENYRFLAEKTCPDHPGILSTIASAYFYSEGDTKKAVSYLERAVAIDPYYMAAIRLLTKLCGTYDWNTALKWARIYVQREWNKENIAEVDKEFGL